MPNYISSLTGSQLDSALNQVEQRVPEGWAVGEKNGIPVSSSSPYYHNNAKYYADYAQGQAERAEAAVPAGTAGAVFFDRVQTLTDSQKEQARQNIQAGGSNRNLLDNPFFRINQRGGSSYSNGYSVDRWSVYNVTATIGDMDNGGAINLHRTDSGAGFFQRIPYDASLIGKQFTLSVMFDDGDIFSATLNMPSTGVTSSSTYRNVKLSLSTAGTYHQFTIYLYTQPTDTDPSIKAAKLELGSVSTLANDTPPKKRSVLADCRYYFRRLQNTLGYSQGVFLGLALSATQIDIPNITSGEPMRTISPTITSSGTFTLSGAGSPTFTSLTRITDMDGHVGIRITGSGFTPNTVYKLNFGAGAYIDISSDL